MRDQSFNTDITYHQVVLFEKAGEYGILALTRNRDGFTVIGRSCRHSVDHSPQTEGFAAAKRNFENSVQTSVDEGWRVAWRGFPHCGDCGGKLD